MNKKNIINNNRKLCLSQDFLSTESRKSRKYVKKESLFNQKNTLRQILSQIKYCLIDSLSNKTARNKNIITKEILTAFKDNLISMLEEKNKIYNSYIKEKRNICRKKSDNLKKYRNYIDDQKLLNSDVSQLNLLNFLIENEIKKIDSLIEQHSQTNLYIKTLPLYIGSKKIFFL